MANLKHDNRYGALLFRKEWKEKRKEILLRDKNKCIICGEVANLEVHHRQYVYKKAMRKFNLPWDYPNHVLITLCRECHSQGHSKYKIPIIEL